MGGYLLLGRTTPGCGSYHIQVLESSVRRADIGIAPEPRLGAGTTSRARSGSDGLWPGARGAVNDGISQLPRIFGVAPPVGELAANSPSSSRAALVTR